MNYKNYGNYKNYMNYKNYNKYITPIKLIRNCNKAVIAVDYLYSRVAANLGTDREIMNNLEHIIRNHNIFAGSYVMMKEEIDR